MRFVNLLIVLQLSFLSPFAMASITPDELQQIKAIQFNDGKVITSGLPKKSEFPALKASGIELVINLIPTENPNGYSNEAELVTQAGMDYEGINVDWQNPTIDDVGHFFSIMEANQDKQILVHCAANYRASAFYYLYLLKNGHSDSIAYQQKVMAPWGELTQALADYPQWANLIEQVKANINE
ncbi:protein tyrosine phosphatase family protein [Shewanella sp. 0m-8]